MDVVIDHYQKLHDEFKQQFLDFAKILGRLLRQKPWKQGFFLCEFRSSSQKELLFNMYRSVNQEPRHAQPKQVPPHLKPALLQVLPPEIRKDGHRCYEFKIHIIGYIGLQSVSLLNFEEGWEHTESIMNPLPLGRMKLPADSSGGITKYEDKRLQLSFQAEQGVRRIRCQFENFHQGKNFSCELELAQPPMDSMVIATPWAEKNLKSQRFYS